MKESIITSLITIILSVFTVQISAQDATQENNYSLAFGLGYFAPILSEEGITFSNATYNPQVGAGFSYFASFDYKLSEKFALGMGFNGNYAGAEFIQNAIVDDQQVNGYLEAGAVANTHILLNLTYARPGEGIQPYAKLGVGYFIEQVELGDVPLELTNNVETELFPDFKSSGIGLLPELGARYNDLAFSVAYSFPFDDLTGETVPGGYLSVGSIASQGLQINVTYRISLF
jgi:hypothetical protein